MRGRTLNDSFVILDEAQNATSDQMRMFLTRLGFGSQACVTGDITQTDLPQGARSGLREARDLLQHIDGIAFCEFTDADVVRHPLVQRIIVAYEQRDERRVREKEARRARLDVAARGALERLRSKDPAAAEPDADSEAGPSGGTPENGGET